MNKKIAFIAAIYCLSFMLIDARSQSSSTDVTINFNKIVGSMNPVWAWFGYDEPNYTYMKDGRKLLSEIADFSPVPVYIRAHNLLCTHDGPYGLKWGSTNAYTEDENGNPVYDWTVIDSIFDTYVERGMKPLAQIGFMPKALSTEPEPYRHNWQPGIPYHEIYTGWSKPPKDYNKWGELVYQWVLHSVERYGKEEVESWYWELWNEADSPYWGGTLEEFLKLNDYTAHAARRALPSIKYGGPHVTGPGGKRGADFMHAFLNHCISGKNYVTGETGSKLDFIAFHAKGSPRVVDGHVRMDIRRQLLDISNGFAIVASYPELKHLPIIIGESDPEGCAACGMATNPENAYRNGTMYSSYTAASFARKYSLADSLGVNLLGAVSWSFEFENQPWFYGFRDLATNGVNKPVLNVFRMFAMMQGQRVEVKSNQMYPLEKVLTNSIRDKQPDIGGLAAIDEKTAAVMLWNYHDDDIPNPPSEVVVTIKGFPGRKATLSHYRIDLEHSNSYELWKKMGSPQNPTPEQIVQLEQSGKLAMMGKPQKVSFSKGNTVIKIQLPHQGISLLKLDW